MRGTHFVVACHVQVCIIYNANCTRRLFSFDIAQAIQSSTDRPVNVAKDGDILNRIWFTSAAKVVDQDSEEEFIAVATNDGRIFSIQVQGGGAQFVTDCAYTTAQALPIVTLSADPRTKVLLAATGLG